jgi:hypothetical protein
MHHIAALFQPPGEIFGLGVLAASAGATLAETVTVGTLADANSLGGNTTILVRDGTIH